MRHKLNCIMIIDDDEPTNFISKMLIEEAACTHHLQVMDSGIKALEYLQQAVDCVKEKPHIIPDLMFVDINMPRMNGWEFLEEYQKLKPDHLRNTVIVMLTTSLNPDDKSRAASIPHITAFENKPLTPEMIEKVIANYCSAAGKSVA